MVRLMLMYYVDFIAFMENPEKTWNDFLAKEMQKAPPEPSLLYNRPRLQGTCQRGRLYILQGFGEGIYALLCFTGQQ